MLVVLVELAAAAVLVVLAEPAVAAMLIVLAELAAAVLVLLAAAAELAATSATVGAFVFCIADQFEEPHPVENRAVRIAASNRHCELFPIVGEYECTTASLMNVECY